MPDITILLYSYNHSQHLEVGADGTSTYPRDPSQEEENDYKKGSKERQKGGGGTPNAPKAPGKTPPRLWENPPRMNIVEGKRGNRPSVARLQIVPQGMESTKVEKDNG